MSDHPFGLRENPFAAGDVRRFVHPSAGREQLQARLLRGLRDGEPFILLTGESGTGKTSIVRETFGNRKDHGSIAIISNPALTRSELLEEICIRFDLQVPEAPSKPQLMALLEQHLVKVRGQSNGLAAVLVIDEAHLLDADLLEELRLLANMQVKGRKLLQVVLVGLPSVEAILAQPRLEPLRQRITVHAQIYPLDAAQTREYVHHRLVTASATTDLIPDQTCHELHALSRGIVREINSLASEAMVWAHSEGATAVTAEHVRAVAATRPTPIAGPDPVAAEPVLARPAARKRRAEDATPATEPAAAAKPATETSELERLVAAPTHPEAETMASSAPDPEPAASASATPPAGAPTPRRRKGEVAVDDWVSRFRGEGPILIGSRAGPPLSLAESLALDAPTGHELATPEPRRPTGPKPRLNRPRGGRGRRGSRGWADPTRLSLAAMAVLAVTTVVILMPRAREGQRAKSRTAPATVSSSLSAAAPRSEASQARATRTRKAEADIAPTPAKVASRPPPAAAPVEPPAPAPMRYALVVATYLDEFRARDEVDRLATLTALPARYRIANDESGTTYRILLGRFESRTAAERTAEDLLGRGIVGEAQITRLNRSGNSH